MRKNDSIVSRRILENNTLEIIQDEDFFKLVFYSDSFLGEYGNFIISDILKKEEEFKTNIRISESIRDKYLSILYNIIKKLPSKYKSSFNNIFFLTVKMTDKLINILKKKINSKYLQLIYYGSICLAYKFETQMFIEYSWIKNKIKDCIINEKELLDFEWKIHKLLNYNYIIPSPHDFLKIYEYIDETDSNKELDNLCKFLINFALFINSLAEQKISLMTLTIYYFAKYKLTKKFHWSNQIQFLIGYDKDTIIINIKKFIKIIKNNYHIYSKLLVNDFNNINNINN